MSAGSDDFVLVPAGSVVYGLLLAPAMFTTWTWGAVARPSRAREDER